MAIVVPIGEHDHSKHVQKNKAGKSCRKPPPVVPVSYRTLTVRVRCRAGGCLGEQGRRGDQEAEVLGYSVSDKPARARDGTGVCGRMAFARS